MHRIALHGKKVTSVDSDLLDFSNLEELSLSGNLIKKLDNHNLPTSLKILHLNGNLLKDIPNVNNLTSLVHLGLSYNMIASTPSSIVAFIPLVISSLDLSWNQLINLEETASSLKPLFNLKSLVLYGNPICLLPNYASVLLNELSGIEYFDEVYAKTIACSSSEPASKGSSGHFSSCRLLICLF